MDDFTLQYLNTALWSEVDDNGEPFDANYDVEDFDDSVIQQAIEDCAAFNSMFQSDIDGNETRAAHDLWLTRNHHGAGFWDGDWPEPLATRLTEAAHALGERYVYVGDDGKLYID